MDSRPTIPSEASSQSLVCIGHGFGIAETTLAVSCLEAYGIVVHTADRYMITTFPHYAMMLGGMRLYVSAEKADAAIQILSEITDNPAQFKLIRALIIIAVCMFTHVPGLPVGVFLRSHSSERSQDTASPPIA